MQLNHENREVTSKGVTTKSSFGISRANTAHIMTILRDTLYSDKVLAVLREYGTNAWDAHAMSGQGTRPIEVTLPTMTEPELRIRDYGNGLSAQEVLEVYTQYGESTKRDTDDAVGFMGVGSKSGFAYTDTFTVTSWHGGKKRVFVAVLDPTNVGEMCLLHEETLPDDQPETGIEIQIAVAPKDIFEFVTKAQKLYAYFNPRPTLINGTYPPDTLWRVDNVHGKAAQSPTPNQWVAVMGGVPYALDTTAVKSPLAQAGLDGVMANLSGQLHFAIGEVRISASREQLKYTDTTKDKIAAKFRALIDTHIAEMEAFFTNPANNISSWQRILDSAFIHNQLHAKGETAFRLWDTKNPPKAFTIVCPKDDAKRPVAHIYPSLDTKLIFKDCAYPLPPYYRADSRDYYVLPCKGVSPDVALAALYEVITAAGVTGVPIVKTSELPPPSWREEHSRHRGSAVANPKHTAKAFWLRNPERAGEQRNTYSDLWETLPQHVPSPTDVYVILEHFQVNRVLNHEHWYETVAKDAIATRHLTGSNVFPTIYGYKKAKSPTDPTPIGIPYGIWRKTFIADALKTNPAAQQKLDAFAWKCGGEVGPYSMHESDKIKAWHATISAVLGPTHAITTFLANMAAAPTVISQYESSKSPILRFHTKGAAMTEAERELAKILANYPLLASCGERGLGPLFTTKTPNPWLGYILLVDRDNQATARAQNCPACVKST